MNYFAIRKTERQKRNRKIASAAFWFIGFIALLGFAGESDRKSMEPVQIPVKQTLTPKELKIKSVLDKAGSPHSLPLSKAIAQTKRPRLVTAVVLQESGGDLNAVGLAGELGCGQVMAEHWGPVPKDAAGQVKQVEQILEELLASSQGKIKLALNKYNGDHSGRYARQVEQKIAMVRL